MSVAVGVALRQILLADATVYGLVGTRIRRAPLREHDEPVPTLPAITYQRAGSIRGEHFEGRWHPSQIRMQVDCWAYDGDAVEALFDAVRIALDMKVSASHDIQKIAIVDGSDQALDEPEVKLYRFTADYYVWIAEAVA